MATLKFVIPWKNGIIPYVNSHPDSDPIKSAINQVEKKTLVKFKQRENENDYASFLRCDGNVVNNSNWKVPLGAEHPQTSDSLGYCKGQTNVCLKENSWLAMHEIGHLLGLMHIHQRNDTLVYIERFCNNIGCDSPDFIIWNTSVNQDLPYDPESVMHYGATWQAKEGTIGLRWIGNPNEGIHISNNWSNLTPADVHSINRLYLKEYPPFAFLFVYRMETGYISSNLLVNDNRGANAEIDGKNVESNYRIIIPFISDFKYRCLLYRPYNANRIDFADISSYGQLKSVRENGMQYSEIYTSLKYIKLQDKDCIVAYASDSGILEVYQILKNTLEYMKGTRQKWTSGYTTVEPFSMNENNYCIFHKEESGYLFTAQIFDNGYIDEMKGSQQNWSSGYTTIKPFVKNGKNYAICYKSGTGYLFIARIYDNGYIDEIKGTQQNWSTGYDLMNIAYINNNPVLIAYKPSTGYIISCNINDDLYVDQYWSDTWTGNYSSLFCLRVE